MSLGIAVKSPEGIVIAADSRVTLLAQRPGPSGSSIVVPATFDNATKLLSVPSQTHVAAITYGAGAIGLKEPRTAASFMPEFDAELVSADESKARVSVKTFAEKLSAFFLKRWTAGKMPTTLGQDMIFIVAGYDEDPTATFGRLFQIKIPSQPNPEELLAGSQFGAAWGGQRELTDRLVHGFDPTLPTILAQYLKVPAEEQQKTVEGIEQELRAKLTIPIPWQFLPLQDCVDVSIFLLRTTITLQKWTVGIRGVGGAIDLAAITGVGGYKPIQQKRISGETV
jgi:hypothetical protein